jgi:hypothetical protein
MIEDTDRVNRWYKVDGSMGSMLHFILDWSRLLFARSDVKDDVPMCHFQGHSDHTTTWY